MEINHESINAFCRSREVDLVVKAPQHPSSFGLHGEFDGYGDFFSILFSDVEYIDISGGFTLGGIKQLDFREAKALAKKWEDLGDEYSGPALVLWSADACSFSTAEDKNKYLIVAGRIEYVAGNDWQKK